MWRYFNIRQEIIPDSNNLLGKINDSTPDFCARLSRLPFFRRLGAEFGQDIAIVVPMVANDLSGVGAEEFFNGEAFPVNDRFSCTRFGIVAIVALCDYLMR